MWLLYPEINSEERVNCIGQYMQSQINAYSKLLNDRNDYYITNLFPYLRTQAYFKLVFNWAQRINCFPHSSVTITCLICFTLTYKRLLGHILLLHINRAC